ncbi:uncharacterized protein BXZ73DRAFT_82359 [Epithele typhae]|uniref:uncharacterized protein n=1 Tax=Epithele typhae TaxID=378194 RepID=UPI002008E898|nr:uncharacterized protein BXZ73DRAFT_82359 [Epithele typhae]KAH9912351.1 hypothetical protein BXZ73DRAFT_82359 [Epithele typhae]
MSTHKQGCDQPLDAGPQAEKTRPPSVTHAKEPHLHSKEEHGDEGVAPTTEYEPGIEHCEQLLARSWSERKPEQLRTHVCEHILVHKLLQPRNNAEGEVEEGDVGARARRRRRRATRAKAGDAEAGDAHGGGRREGERCGGGGRVGYAKEAAGAGGAGRGAVGQRKRAAQAGDTGEAGEGSVEGNARTEGSARAEEGCTVEEGRGWRRATRRRARRNAVWKSAVMREDEGDVEEAGDTGRGGRSEGGGRHGWRRAAWVSCVGGRRGRKRVGGGEWAEEEVKGDVFGLS